MKLDTSSELMLRVTYAMHRTYGRRHAASSTILALFAEQLRDLIEPAVISAENLLSEHATRLPPNYLRQALLLSLRETVENHLTEAAHTPPTVPTAEDRYRAWRTNLGHYLTVIGKPTLTADEPLDGMIREWAMMVEEDRSVRVALKASLGIKGESLTDDELRRAVSAVFSVAELS